MPPTLPEVMTGSYHPGVPVKRTSSLLQWKHIFSIPPRYDQLLYGEELFRSLLVLERKRAERLNNSFLLMLIDISAFFNSPIAPKIISTIIGTVSGAVRETDITGWYTSGKIIGIMFTDITGADKEKVVHKMKELLRYELPVHRYSEISITHYLFPLKKHEVNYERYNLHAVIYDRKPEHRSTEHLAEAGKRIIDIAASICGLILFSPLFIVLPVLIKLTSRGPVFFKQERLGMYGKKFKVLKFRTMHTDNNNEHHRAFMREFIKNSGASPHADQEKIFKITDDPRVTPVGKFLRKTSLDELPQFINVLFGNMSMVGPRPAIPYEVDEYDIWHKRRVFEVKPGITGIWQVAGRSRTDFDNMVRMDIRYIKEWSPMMDIMLILKTPFALLTAKGAY